VNGQPRSAYFVRLNLNKKSMTLDVQKPKGKEIFRELVKVSDVVLDNFRPGVVERLELDFAHLSTINPKIICASVSGFGHADLYQSPYMFRPAYDALAQALSGMMDLTGEENTPPIKVGVGIGDYYPGTIMALGICMALFNRERTGKGDRIDISMYDAMTFMCNTPIANYSLTKELPERGKFDSVAPYGAFKAKDGYVCIAANGEPAWRNLCMAMGREDLLDHPQLRTGVERVKNKNGLVKQVVESWTNEHDRAEIVDILTEHDVAAGPVQNMDDVYACPHLKARKMLWDVEHPWFGKIKEVTSPVKMASIPDSEPRHAPLLGEHTDEVLTGLLHYSPDQIAQLRSDGVV